VANVEAADAGRRSHGQALGHGHADLVALQQREHVLLDAVVRAGRVAGRGANASVLFARSGLQLLSDFAGGIAPQVFAHTLVHGIRRRPRPGGRPGP